MLQYSYDLTKASNLWIGKERAIFYVNKFCFLSDQIPSSVGYYAQEFELNYKEEWSMSFTLKINGNLRNQQEGFVFSIQEQKQLKFMNQQYKENLVADYNLIDSKGIFLWINESTKQLKIGNNFNKKTSKEIDQQVCNLNEYDQTINIFIQKQNESIKIYQHQSNDQQYKLCAEIKNMFTNKQLYISMAAKSTNQSILSFHLTQMFANLDVINSKLDQQNTNQNEDITKLFHGIYLNLPEETADKIVLGKSIQVSDLYKNEKKIEENLKQSLSYLRNSLTSAQIIKDQIQYSKTLRKDQKLNVLTDIDKFLEMSKNSEIGDMGELSNIKQDERNKGLYQTSQNIKMNLKNIVNFFERNQELFYQLKVAHEQISENLDFLENWTLSHKNFTKSLEILHDWITYTHNFKANKSLAILIGLFGGFIILVLLTILHRVSSTKQINLKV